METKFKHSIKVPTQYKKAANALKTSMQNRSKTLKELIFQEKHAKTNKLYALLDKVVKNIDVLDILIEKSEILTNEPRLEKCMCYVLMTELLFGVKKLNGESKPVQTVLSYHDKFNEILSSSDTVSDKNETPKPRYVRVNTLMMSRADALEAFKNQGWNDVTSEYQTYDDFLAAIEKLDDSSFLSDMHVKDMFVFPTSSKRFWALNPLTKESKVILQDKASTLPSMLLNPPRGSVVLDMCAAPGMKTTHMAALMKNRGKIWAVERVWKRHKMLSDRVQNANCKIVETINEDILCADVKTFEKVEYILLDPPCTGSGMVNRLALVSSIEKDEDERLWNIGGVQIRMLIHAMTKFPNAIKIVYSTCSIHPNENEHVVARSLEAVDESYGWKLVKPEEFAEKWKNFGSKTFKHIGKKCIYARTEIDRTDGFFVAILERNLTDLNDEAIEADETT